MGTLMHTNVMNSALQLYAVLLLLTDLRYSVLS